MPDEWEWTNKLSIISCNTIQFFAEQKLEIKSKAKQKAKWGEDIMSERTSPNLIWVD